MNHKHTAGPWEIEDLPMMTSVVTEDDEICDLVVGNKENDEVIANARLIAAAPEMLEVLCWLDNEIDCRDDEYGSVIFSRGDFEKVRHAIKLAMEG